MTSLQKKIEELLVEYLNDKIKKETKDSIKNFLIFNSGSKGKLKINPQYL